MTQTVAISLVGLVAAFSPLILKYIHLEGPAMMALTLVVSVLITAGAGLAAGDLHFDRASLILVISGSGTFWTIQQVVYQLLKESAPRMVVTPPTPPPPRLPGV